MSSIIPPVPLQRTWNLYTTNITNNQSIGNVNIFTENTQSFSTNGDICILGSTPKFCFDSGNKSAPTLNTRSDGSRLILEANISSSSLDTCFGLSNNGLWLSCTNFEIYTNNSVSKLVTFNSDNFTIDSSIGTSLVTDSFTFSFNCKGDSYFEKNILCNTGTGVPSITGNRSLGTKIMLKTQENIGVYENAIGYDTSKGVWLSSSDKVNIYSQDFNIIEFSKDVNIILLNNSHSTLSFTESDCSIVSRGDVGISNGNSLFFDLTDSDPVSNVNNNGVGIVLAPNCLLGINSSGTYISTSSVITLYNVDTEVMTVSNNVSILDIDGVDLIDINPSHGDILGTRIFNSVTFPLSFISITGLSFSYSRTRYFECMLLVEVNTTSTTFRSIYNISGLYDGTVYDLKYTESYDISNIFVLDFQDDGNGNIQFKASTLIPDFIDLNLYYKTNCL